MTTLEQKSGRWGAPRSLGGTCGAIASVLRDPLECALRTGNRVTPLIDEEETSLGVSGQERDVIGASEHPVVRRGIAALEREIGTRADRIRDPRHRRALLPHIAVAA